MLPTLHADSLGCHVDQLLLIHVFAVWNGHSRAMNRLLAGLAGNSGEMVEFFSMDFDDTANWSFFREHQITQLPCILLVRDKNIVGRLVGSVDEATIVKYVAEHLY